MIAILLTTASTRAELDAEWARWLEAYGKPPAAVLGHNELPLEFLDQRGAETTYEGVRVLTLYDFLNLHGDDLDPDGDDDEDDDLDPIDPDDEDAF